MGTSIGPKKETKKSEGKKVGKYATREMKGKKVVYET